MWVVARTRSSNPSCQPHVWLFAVEIISLSARSPMPPLTAGCQRKASRLGAGGTGASCIPLEASVYPLPAGGWAEWREGPPGFHAVRSASVRQEPQSSLWPSPWCLDHFGTLQGLTVSSTDYRDSPEPRQGAPVQKTGWNLWGKMQACYELEEEGKATHGLPWAGQGGLLRRFQAWRVRWLATLSGWLRKGCQRQGGGLDDFHGTPWPVPNVQASSGVTSPPLRLGTTLQHPHMPLPYEAGASSFPRIEARMLRGPSVEGEAE